MKSKAVSLFRSSFGAEPAVVTRAPGRIEFIGNHTDYNAGTVLGAAIDRGITIAARLRTDGAFAFVSDNGAPTTTVRGRPLTPQQGGAAWVNYPLGVVVALEGRGMPAVAGLEMAVVSDLPPGAGLSSSAAFELSTALALCALQEFTLSREEVVKAGREAENKFVGVPCGILDQGVSGFGKKDSLVHIDCRGPVFSLVPMPAGVRFWIFNTHKKHALVDSLYATRHKECMDAARLLKPSKPGAQWLADFSPAEFAAAAAALPAAAAKRAKHVIEEIARVDAMGQALKSGNLAEAGRLLFASHESSRTLFENSTPELDFLVATLRGVPGVYGSRLTGGGFGGAVMAMTDASFDATAAARVADAYAAKFTDRPDVLACATADGAAVV
ncbi:MAG: galactokinase [Opitutaceae bacterium]|nr:galactokinase [Opitutaceae bacterium]